MGELLVDMVPLPLPPVVNLSRDELVDYLINLNEFKYLKVSKIAKYLKVHRLSPGERISDEFSNENMIIVKRGTIGDPKSSKYFVENNIIYPDTEDMHLKATDYCLLLTLSADKVKKYFPKAQSEESPGNTNSNISVEGSETILMVDGVNLTTSDSFSSQKSHTTDKPNSKPKKSNSDIKSESTESTIKTPSTDILTSKNITDLSTSADVSVKDHPLYNFFRSIGKKSLPSQESFKTPFPSGSNISKWFASCFEKHVLKQDSSIVSPEIFVVTKGKVAMKHVGYFGIETNVGSIPRGKIIGLDSEMDCNYYVQSSNATVYILPCKLHDKIIMCLKEWDKITTFARNITGSTSAYSEIINVLALGPDESVGMVCVYMI